MRLALGTAQFGLPYGIANQDGQVTRSAAKAMLDLAAAQGINMLDTAIAYGESESCLGDAGIQGFKLVTKLPPVPESCGDISRWVHEQIDASLARLGLKTVYGLLLHRPEQLLGTNGNTLYHAMHKLKENGQVQKIGISIYAPGELEALTRKFHFELIQAPFNLVDRRLSRSGWLQRLKDEGIEVHTRSAFLQGLLLMSLSAIPPKFAPWAVLWSQWHDWLARHPVSAIQACLAYPLSFPEIDRVVVGADNVNHLKQIINAVLGDIPGDFPDLCCEEENLINPSRWANL